MIQFQNYSSELRFNDIKNPFAYGEENICLCCIKKISPFKNIKIQQKKTNISIYIKKEMKTKVLFNMVTIM